MAFIEGISRLQRIVDFISIDFRSKKEIMAYLREYNTIISYKTLERDLKQIKEELGFDLEYKRNLGYRCENKYIVTSNSTNFFPLSFEQDNAMLIAISVINKRKPPHHHSLIKP